MPVRTTTDHTRVTLLLHPMTLIVAGGISVALFAVLLILTVLCYAAGAIVLGEHNLHKGKGNLRPVRMKFRRMNTELALISRPRV